MVVTSVSKNMKTRVPRADRPLSATQTAGLEYVYGESRRGLKYAVDGHVSLRRATAEALERAGLIKRMLPTATASLWSHRCWRLTPAGLETAIGLYNQKTRA